MAIRDLWYWLSCFALGRRHRNKDRLYIGLCVRGGPSKMPGKEDTYHWALLSGPKKEPTSGCRHVMHHVKRTLVIEGHPKVAKLVWEYSAECGPVSMLLVRIVVGKVANIRQLEKVLETVPIRGDMVSWNDVSWVREALHLAATEPGALGSRVEDWEAIRKRAMWYVDQKKASHRFDGLGQFDYSKPATWDMLQDKELTV